MSDKLVSLNAVLALLNAISQDEITDECYDRLYNAVANMDAAPQEMSAREYGEIVEHICEKYGRSPCDACPLGKAANCAFPNHYTVSIVEKYVKEHPGVSNHE